MCSSIETGTYSDARPKSSVGIDDRAMITSIRAELFVAEPREAARRRLVHVGEDTPLAVYVEAPLLLWVVKQGGVESRQNSYISQSSVVHRPVGRKRAQPSASLRGGKAIVDSIWWGRHSPCHTYRLSCKCHLLELVGDEFDELKVVHGAHVNSSRLSALEVRGKLERVRQQEEVDVLRQ